MDRPIWYRQMTKNETKKQMNKQTTQTKQTNNNNNDNSNDDESREGYRSQIQRPQKNLTLLGNIFPIRSFVLLL